MDILQIFLLAAAAIGIFLMVITLIRFTKEDENSGSSSYFEIDNNIKAINSSLEEAEKAVEELNSFSETVMTGIDDKYQELLFIYNLIEEKKNEIMRMYGNVETQKPVEQPEIKKNKVKPKQPDPKTNINPKYDEILSMYENGMSISEISKNMDMGQGEVKLILELTKTR